MEWVFAFGSNMHLADLRRWLGERGYATDDIHAAVPARLAGYELVWDYYSPPRRGGAANIQPASERTLYGVALQVGPNAWRGIDHKEGHPHRYHRGAQPQRLELADGHSVAAWVYRVQPAFRWPYFIPPRRNYLQLMLEAAVALDLPDAHINALRRVTVLEDHPGGEQLAQSLAARLDAQVSGS